MGEAYILINKQKISRFNGAETASDSSSFNRLDPAPTLDNAERRLKHLRSEALVTPVKKYPLDSLNSKGSAIYGI